MQWWACSRRNCQPVWMLWSVLHTTLSSHYTRKLFSLISQESPLSCHMTSLTEMLRWQARTSSFVLTFLRSKNKMMTQKQEEYWDMSLQVIYREYWPGRKIWLESMLIIYILLFKILLEEALRRPGRKISLKLKSPILERFVRWYPGLRCRR